MNAAAGATTAAAAAAAAAAATFYVFLCFTPEFKQEILQPLRSPLHLMFTDFAGFPPVTERQYVCVD